jgi:predicted Fe-Mo cluster-binding NifX family protein
MSICITADSAYIDGKTGEFFGRCKYFIFIEPENYRPSAIVTGRIGKNARK